MTLSCSLFGRQSRPLMMTALGLAAVLAGSDDGPTSPKSSQTRIVIAPARVFNMILFTRWWLAGPDLRSGLFRMKSDGSELTCLDSIPDAYHASPHYSPDGTRIVYERSAPGVHEVWLLNADGSGPHRSTPDGEHWASPEWFPDGSRIVLSRATAIGWRIYTAKPDAADTLKVFETDVANSNQSQPSWSPDGESIVYVDDHGVYDVTDFSWIDVVNADGTNIPHDISPDWGSSAP